MCFYQLFYLIKQPTQNNHSEKWSNDFPYPSRPSNPGQKNPKEVKKSTCSWCYKTFLEEM